MATEIHFDKTDSIKVEEDFEEIVKRLEAGGWVRLGEGSTVINTATVRCIKDLSKPADPLVAWV